MRLVCPNCDAEYEVDASLIPDSGRDVQCSNCGHTWFQAAAAAEDDEPAGEAAPPVAAQTPPAPASPAPEAARAAEAHAPAVPVADEAALAILREEAAQETAARRAEQPQSMETQTEMGLDAVVASMVAQNPVVADPVAERIARLKASAPAAKPQTRREMLPEIDEINSTLRATSEPRGGDDEVISDTMLEDEPRRRSSFRNGFLLMVLVAALLAITYVMAPRIAEQIPGARPAMQAFVSGVDAARLMLDRVLKMAISFMNGLTNGQA